MRSNKPTILRKMDDSNPGYMSNIEEARKRYEEQIMMSKNINKKNLDEFHQFIDESNKFHELKNIQ